MDKAQFDRIRKIAAMILLEKMKWTAMEHEKLTPTEQQATVADLASTLAEYAKAIDALCT